MKKKKYMYMHTLNNYPARYTKYHQICYVNTYGIFMGKLVPSLSQIRKEQRMSNKWREKQGFDVGEKEHSYIRVELS